MRLSIAVSALLLLPLATAAGQGFNIAAGARVRVTAPNDDLKRHITTVTDMRGDSIVVALRDSSRTIALANVAVLEISTGKRRRVVRDAAVGLTLGAIAGAVAGVAIYRDCESESFCVVPETEAESALVGAAILGAAGLITGAIVGAFDRSDRWEAVTVPTRISVAPTPSGRVAFSVSWSF